MKKLSLTLLAVAVTLAAAAGGISSAADLAAFAEAVNAGGDIAPHGRTNAARCT